jgi:hypothetical protein
MFVRLTKTLTICSALFLIISSATIVSAQEKFGYVLDLRGDWLANGSAKLGKGSALNTNSVITAVNPSDTSSYIVVADRSGNIFQRRTCSAGECGNPIKVPANAGNEQGFVSRLIGAAMALVSSEPAKYSTFVSRGSRGIGPELQEAVVKMSGDEIDLSEVFKNMQGEKYVLRFEPLVKGKTVRGAAPKSMSFAWDPKKPAPLNVNGLTPGLYRVSISDVSLLEAEGSDDPGENEAWVLITSPDYYSRAAPSFVAAQNVTKKWGSDVKKNAVREFLRASLDFLTAQTQ